MTDGWGGQTWMHIYERALGTCPSQKADQLNWAEKKQISEPFIAHHSTGGVSLWENF